MKDVNAVPQYLEIEKIEIKLSDGSLLFIEGYEAREWAQAVDWGIRAYNANRIFEYGSVRSDFGWKKKELDESW